MFYTCLFKTRIGAGPGRGARGGAGGEERPLVLLHDRRRRARQRRAGVAEEGEHAVLLDQLLGVGLGARHLVVVVDADELDLAAVHAPSLVHSAEIGEGAVADVVAELGVDAGEGRRLADEDAARVDAGWLGLRAGHRGGERRGSGNSQSASFKCEHGDALSWWCYGWGAVYGCLSTERRTNDRRRTHVLLQLLARQLAEAAVQALAEDRFRRHEFPGGVVRAEAVEAAVQAFAGHPARRHEFPGGVVRSEAAEAGVLAFTDETALRQVFRRRVARAEPGEAAVALFTEHQIGRA